MAPAPEVVSVRPRWRSVWPLGLLLLGVAGAFWPLLALPTAFLCFIGALALPGPSVKGGRSARWLLVAAALGASVGVWRFVVTEAMPGIVAGGHRAVQQGAVSRLREVLFAQDAMRRAGWIDPDADGIGSAAFLGELCGGPPLRGQAERATPVLGCGPLVATSLGPAARGGAYLYTVCLPGPIGSWSAQPEAAVDEERAERRFIAYAWPEAATVADSLFFLDQDENILWAPVPTGAVRAGPASEQPPAAMGLSCATALEDPAGSWVPWREKKARTGPLPGDTANARDGTRAR